MPQKFRLIGLFEKQQGKATQTLLKSASQHAYHIHSSLAKKLSWKMSLLLTCKTLGLLVNTLPADDKYRVLNRENLFIAMQMPLSQKRENFFGFFSAFFKIYMKCRIF